jgi:hypothetical protein
MSELTAAAIEEGLEGRLTDGPVAVSDVVAHTEGWSRDTVSFTATWTEGEREREERYVLRVENEDPATRPSTFPTRSRSSRATGASGVAPSSQNTGLATHR